MLPLYSCSMHLLRLYVRSILIWSEAPMVFYTGLAVMISRKYMPKKRQRKGIIETVKFLWPDDALGSLT